MTINEPDRLALEQVALSMLLADEHRKNWDLDALELYSSVFISDMLYLFQPVLLQYLSKNRERFWSLYIQWELIARENPTPETRYPKLLKDINVFLFFTPEKLKKTSKYPTYAATKASREIRKREKKVNELLRQVAWVRDPESFQGSPAFYQSKRIIEMSAFWHRKGDIVHSPGHAENMTKGYYGYQLTLGGNSFLVERAFLLSASLIRESLDKYVLGEELNIGEIESKIASYVQGSVANTYDEIYQGDYPEVDGYMMFGVQSIHIESAVDAIIKASRILDLEE